MSQDPIDAAVGRAKLRQLLRDHGERWHIQLVSTHWEAVTHPSPSRTIVHIADSLDALRSKIESEGS